MNLKRIVLTLFVGAVAALPISANDMPMIPSGLEIVIPTHIANIHGSVTHVVIAASLTGPTASGRGWTVAEVNAERQIDEEVVVPIETHVGNVFETETLGVNLLLCTGAPTEHLASGELMDFDTFNAHNLNDVCHIANGYQSPAWAYIDNWDGTTYMVPIADLLPQ